MVGRLVNNGEDVALQYLVGRIGATQNLVLRLYTNDKTPAETDTAGSYNEATFAGYAGVVLVGANWVMTPGDPSKAEYAQQIFSCTAGGDPQNIYGYFVTRAGSGDLIFAERFTGAPFVIQNVDDTIKVEVSIRAKDEQE